MAETDVLDHPNARDFVVAVAFSEGAVIANRDSAMVRQSGFTDSLLCQRQLILAQRDARRICPVVPSRVHDQPAPAAADIKETIARLQAQLTADQIQFCFLR